MFSLFPQSASPGSLTRRDLLKGGTVASAATFLPQIIHASAVEPRRATAKRCIYIFLCGGPSQLDLWDPKPNAPDAVRGPFHPISTNVPGLQIGDLLPLTAQRADCLALIRSMNHGSNSHDVGIKYSLLADSQASGPAYPPRRTDHPGVGGILSKLLGSAGPLPAWVTVPRPFTTGNRFYRGQTGGFLGAAYDPFALQEEKKDSLADKTFKLKMLDPPEDVDQRRFANRRQLLQSMERRSEHLRDSTATGEVGRYYQQAFDLIDSEEIRGAFNLENESPELRERYGRNEYGQSFLLARRLIESGTRFVNVFWTYYGPDGCQFNLWDNHGSDKPVCGGYNTGLEMIRGKYCCPAFDLAFSALLDDLKERGLLDETLVVVTGEFGRTPKINKNAGRDHWCHCYSTVLAGGGIQGGAIYGASDKQAAYVKEDPVRPEDLGATVLHAFGIEPETAIHDSAGRPVRSSSGRAVRGLF